MDYCVIALNEASTSACTNKFDLANFEGSVWLLGINYKLPDDIDKFIEDIKSKIWMTYRKNFPAIDENYRYTSDRGFGCMIRCGQMVLSNALILKKLDRNWRWSENFDQNPEIYKRILKEFQDKSSSVYSIHNIVKISQHEGKEIGEWFGPNTIAQSLKQIADGQSDSVSKISIYTALDNIVFKEDVKEKFISSSTQSWLPGVLFIQLRLGLSKINSIYFSALKKTLEFKNSLGIIGGRPNHALYLIGYVDDDIIYLDPHNTQQFIDFDSNPLNNSNGSNMAPIASCVAANMDNQQSVAIDSTYHCSSPEKMPLERLDPSLALCFYFTSEQDFDSWCEQANEFLIKSEQAPMFEIAESRPMNWISPHVAVPALRTSEDIRRKQLERDDFSVTETVSLQDDLSGSIETGLDVAKALTASEENSTIYCNKEDGDDEEFEMLG